MFKAIVLLLAGGCFASAAVAAETRGDAVARYEIRSKELTLKLSADGRIVGLRVGAKQLERGVVGQTLLEGCRPHGDVAAKAIRPGGMEFTWTVAAGKPADQCQVSERFRPAKDSIRWEMEVVADGEPWTVPLVLQLQFPATAKTRFWTAWMHDGMTWEDPLRAKPMSTDSWPYGPYFHRGIVIPIASLLDEDHDAGVSWAISPENALLDFTLSTSTAGEVEFRFAHYRLGKGRVVRLAMDLVPHEADWRGGMRWMVARYPSFFDPPNPNADKMSGCASYSGWYRDVDYARLKKMGFAYRWEASFDWPYYGMFLPPVGGTETWMSSGYGEQSTDGQSHKASFVLMNDRARQMHANGTWHLGYFNVSEFGTQLKSIDVPRPNLSEKDSWKDQVVFLRERIADGIWRDRQGRESHEGWSGAVIMDPAAPHYRASLLEQARRHVEKLPDSDGLCIDRMSWASKEPGDWVKPVNWGGDDGLGWYEGRAGRHFSVSWKSILAGLDPIVHQAGKVIFANPIMGYRLDMMRYVDGYYDEVWRIGPTASLNGTGLLAIRKPATLWTDDEGWLRPDPDAYFQRHLHMGVYPTVPFPKNDHSIRPDPWADQQYLDYGSLLIALRGKKWVLGPHCVETTTPGVKVNLFQVPGGYALPVTFGGRAAFAAVRLRGIPKLDRLRCAALHPGEDQAAAVAATLEDDAMKLRVPLKRGCAMVLLRE